MTAALATDPLVRLQMAGVTPEMPPGTSPFGPVGLPPHSAPQGLSRPPTAPPGLDPRFRSDFLRPFPSPDILQRQLLMEREQSLLAAHQNAAHVAAAAQLAQHEEFFRLEQERARQAAANSRP